MLSRANELEPYMHHLKQSLLEEQHRTFTPACSTNWLCGRVFASEAGGPQFKSQQETDFSLPKH